MKGSRASVQVIRPDVCEVLASAWECPAAWQPSSSSVPRTWVSGLHSSMTSLPLYRLLLKSSGCKTVLHSGTGSAVCCPIEISFTPFPGLSQSPLGREQKDFARLLWALIKPWCWPRWLVSWSFGYRSQFEEHLLYIVLHRLSEIA